MIPRGGRLLRLFGSFESKGKSASFKVGGRRIAVLFLSEVDMV
jgi:hypothetical protein